MVRRCPSETIAWNFPQMTSCLQSVSAQFRRVSQPDRRRRLAKWGWLDWSGWEPTQPERQEEQQRETKGLAESESKREKVQERAGHHFERAAGSNSGSHTVAHVLVFNFAFSQAIQQQPKERPDANHHLKFTYGVRRTDSSLMAENIDIF